MANRKVIRLLIAFISVIASIVLTGWVYDIEPFISISPNMTAMNPVTACCFLLAAIWLAIRFSKKESSFITSFIECLIATFIFLVGLFKIAEYAGLTAMHADRWLFAAKLEHRLKYNAIAPTSALLFLLCGIALLISYKNTKARKIASDAILLTSFLIAYLGIIGYIYSLEPFYRIGPFVPMALNTAFCFMALTVALFLTEPPGNLYETLFSKHIGGKLVRRAIPLVLLIPPFFGYSRLLLHRAQFYNVEYGVALDTAFLVLVVLLFIFYYANILNRQDFERKKTEMGLSQSEEKYRSLVHAMQEGVVYYDKDGKILFCNPGFTEILGYTADEIMGKSIISTIVPEENKLRSNERLADRMRGIQEDYETILLHKDGTKKNIAITARPIFKDGELISFLSTLTDITERKKREEDIEAFSASAAHDLNAPLARIEMLSGYLLEYSKDHLNEEDKEFLGAMLKTTVDMRGMLKDLLQFSRIGEGKVNKVAVDMNQLVQDIVNSSRNATVAIDVAPLPEARGDAGAIKQVWANLILNAIKYSSKKEKPEIAIGTILQNKKTIYYVKDNGAGFDMAQSDKLFAPFKRLHAQSDFEGNGLGLPIVKRIVEKHGGKIWAESEVNKGAVFYFTI